MKKSVTTGVNVDIGGKPSVDVSLTIGHVDESVEVKAETVLIQTTNAEIGGVITSEEVTQIQLNGRNYIQLLTLSQECRKQLPVDLLCSGPTVSAVVCSQ